MSTITMERWWVCDIMSVMDLLTTGGQWKWPPDTWRHDHCCGWTAASVGLMVFMPIDFHCNQNNIDPERHGCLHLPSAGKNSTELYHGKLKKRSYVNVSHSKEISGDGIHCDILSRSCVHGEQMSPSQLTPGLLQVGSCLVSPIFPFAHSHRGWLQHPCAASGRLLPSMHSDSI